MQIPKMSPEQVADARLKTDKVFKQFTSDVPGLACVHFVEVNEATQILTATGFACSKNISYEYAINAFGVMVENFADTCTKNPAWGNKKEFMGNLIAHLSVISGWMDEDVEPPASPLQIN